MRTKHLRDLAATALACLALTGCGDKADPKGPEDKGEAHEHKAPHGGEILELGKEEGHVELVHDDAAGKITLYVYGTSLDKPVHVEKPTLTLQLKDGTAAEVALTSSDAKPDGTGHTWTAEHAGFKVEPLDGRLRVKIGGKSYQSPLEPAEHK